VVRSVCGGRFFYKYRASFFKLFGSTIDELKKLCIFGKKIMKKEERIIRQKELIEQYGILLEEMGYQPVTARVSGLLSVMDKELLTFEEIVEELNISKSTASVAIKNLLVRDAIEYITLPGDRKRYFRTKLSNIDREPKDFILWLKKIQKLMQETVELKKDKESRIANYFKDVDEKLNIYIPKMEKLNDELT